MKILVVGAGMYVTGRDGTGTGTVLSSLAELSKTCPIDQVIVIATKPDNEPKVREETKRINSKLQTNLSVSYISVGSDPKNYTEAVLKNKFDAAIVSTPDHLHFAHAKPLLETGVHTLIVKPLTPTLKEAKALLETQRKSKAHGAVEFHKRWDETNLFTKKNIEEGILGDLLYMTVDYSQRIHIPLETFKHWSSQTNIFQYLGVHYVDLIYFLTGFYPRKLSAIGTYGILESKGLKTFDCVNANIVWSPKNIKSKNFISQFAVNWIDPNSSPAMSDQKFKLIGTHGRIECDQRNRGIERLTDRGVDYPNPYFSDYLKNPDGNWIFQGYGHKSISSFILDCLSIKAGNTTAADLEDRRPSLKQSLVSTVVVEAVNESLNRNGEWIELDDSTFS